MKSCFNHFSFLWVDLIRVLKIKIDEEERMREQNRICAKKNRRVRKIEEEYSGDESNCELSETLMLLRTWVARLVPGQPSCREHNQTGFDFHTGSINVILSF